VKRPGARFLAALAIVALTSAFLLVVSPDPIVAPQTQLTLAAITGVAWAAATATAWARYRSSSDPHLLFLSAGAAALVVGTVTFGIALAEGRVGPLPVVGWQLTWLVAAGCLVLARPWRDRRGRPPVRPGNVFGIAAIATGAVVAVSYPLADGLREGFPAARFALGPFGWIVGGAVIFLLLLAAFREDARAQGPRAIGPWLASAFLLAVPMQLAVVHHPLQGTGLLSWADAFTPLIPAIVLVGLLVSQREEISRARRATDRAAEVLGGRAEIASVLAHDVRSPVATIKSLATTTTQSYDRLSDAERTEFVGLIEKEAARLLDTVNQASLALKVDAGTAVQGRYLADLATIVREGLEAVDTAEHPLTEELAPDLTVRADRRYLAEAVRQLVDNAVKFSPAQAPIRITSSTRDGHATVEVADGGPGIPAERRDEVVQRFASWRPRGYEDRTGPGLGLFICKGILAEHDGEMVIDEAPGGGTILRIQLPVEG
jgi:signal transduction histidine kinase